MKLNYTESGANSSSDGEGFLHCSALPQFTWNPNDTITRWCTVVITSLGFILTILLNVLLITAVKLKKQLQNNCNILMCSMAVADLLVGVVSQPLQVICNRLLRSDDSFSPYFCAVNLANVLVGIFASASSVNHLTVIAWERFIAIKIPHKYRVVVTRDLVKKLIVMAWLTALFSIIPNIVTLVIDSKHLLTLDIVFKFPGVVCLILIAYFYTVMCLVIRKHVMVQDRQPVNAFRLAKAKLDSNVVKTTALLTAVLLFSYSPTFGLFFLSNSWPALRDSSYFLWAIMLTQLNSLMNPLLYFYKNQRFRNAALQLIRVRKPPIVRPVSVPVDLTPGQKKTNFKVAERFP